MPPSPTPANLPLLPPSYSTATPPTTMPAPPSPPPVPPLNLPHTPNSTPSTPPHSPSTSACSISPLSQPPAPASSTSTTPLVSPAKPPLIKPTPAFRPGVTRVTPAPANRTRAESPVSPVKAAFQMQCASRVLTTMADVQFPLLNGGGAVGGGGMGLSALRRLEEMSDDELQVCLTQVNNAVEEEEEKKDPNDPEAHVRIWNRRERRKIAGNAAPLRRNVAAYLSTRPDCEVYNNQDKPPGWKPKKKIAKKKRQAQMLMMEMQRRERVRMEERRGWRGVEGCGVCVEQARSRVRYCGNYGCRVKRHRIDGKLHESLRGMAGANWEEVGGEFGMTESCVSDVSVETSMVDLVFEGEEVSGWVAGAVDHEDLLQSRELPSLSREFDDIVDSIV